MTTSGEWVGIRFMIDRFGITVCALASPHLNFVCTIRHQMNSLLGSVELRKTPHLDDCVEVRRLPSYL